MRTPHIRLLSRRGKASFLLFVFAFGLTSTVMFGSPSPANAQYTDPITSIQTTLTNVYDKVSEGLVQGAGSAILSGGNYFLQQLAYQAAVALTSDCPGQIVCWDSKALGEGLAQAAQGALGEAVGTLSEVGGFDKLGFNLCKPPTLNSEYDLTLNIQLGMLDEVKPPKPKCDWNELKKNYEAAANSLTNVKLLTGVTASFKPGQSELSAALMARAKIQAEAAAAKAKAELKAQTDAAAGGGFSPITDPVSGRVKAPATATQEEHKRAEAEGKGEKALEQSGQVTAGQLSSKAVIGVVLSAAQSFAMTLATRLFNKLVKGLMSTEQLVAGQPNIILSREGLLQPPGKKQQELSLKAQFSAFTPREVGTVDPLLVFTVCPSTNRTPQNCVIDTQFATAIRVADSLPLTVREAMAKGLLHPEWNLISSTNNDPRDQDANCYISGYCESNLKKLRAARIIPMGWEIAASQSSVSSPYRLKEVVAGFNDCDATGKADPQHPFCHLIDPDWVLKMPPVQCRAQVYGPQLIDPSIPTRAEVCVDQPSCLSQDDAGNCIGGYGYCSREKNVWRFNGDACPSQFNSCRTLTPKPGVGNEGSSAPVNYLLNTIDFGICNADNSGCAAYSTSQNPAATANDPSDDWLTQPALYLNKNVQTCPANQVGCSSLIRLETGQSLNLVRNGGFEELEDGDADGNGDHPKGWIAPVGTIPSFKTGWIVSNDIQVINGSNSVGLASGAPVSGTCTLMTGNTPRKCDSEDGCKCEVAGPANSTGAYSCRVHLGDTSCYYTSRLVQDRITLRPNKTHTLTVALKRNLSSTGAATVTARLRLRTADGSNVALLPSDVILPASADLALLNQSCTIVDNSIEARATVDTTTPATTLGCTFFVKKVGVALAMLEFTSSGASVFVDDVQLEEGGGTPYHPNYGSASSRVLAKVPPAYLNCLGNDGDRPECANYAGVCRETEVGCSLYRPKNGDPSVPGIVGPQDFCPAACVGYDAFRQEKSEFERDQVLAQFDYFIPTTAKSCSAAEVGCSEFTNLDTEGVEYFTKLRLCQRPDDADSQVFYSWEGSDTTGYQLKVWNLKTTGAKVTNAISDICAETRNDSCDSFKPIGSNGSDPSNDDKKAGLAPCTKIDASTSPTTCEDLPAPTQPGEPPEGYCSRQDITDGNFDCREFYDKDGNRHFRLLSRTILATSDCHPYRISRSSQGDCEATNGRWDDTRKECNYQASGPESTSCAASANNCRAYKGNAASNVRNEFVDDFEAGLANWSGGIEQSPESVTVGGHSLKVKSGAVNRDITDFVSAGRSYQMTFWARGAGDLNITMKPAGAYKCTLPAVCEAGPCTCISEDRPSCDVNTGQDSCFPAPQTGAMPAAFAERRCTHNSSVSCTTDSNCSASPGSKCRPTLTLSSNWRQYAIGPVVVGNPLFTSERIQLEITSSNTAADFYMDNVILKEVQDNILVVRGSWRTPASCDESADGAPSPLEMLGCREYLDAANKPLTLRSFSSLCREKAVGCAAYSSTQSSFDNPHEESFNAVCSLPSACTTGPSCVCNYDQRLRLEDAPSSFAFPPVTLYDVCRVPVGEKECRFTLENWDDSSPATRHPDRVNIPADERLYLVVTKKDQCTADAIGCTQVGLPRIVYDGKCKTTTSCNPLTVPQAQFVDRNGNGTRQASDACLCTDPASSLTCNLKNGESACSLSFENGATEKWKPVALKDDSRLYPKSLCLAAAIGCGEFGSSTGTVYFKDPGTKTCVYKENVSMEDPLGSGNFAQRSGWFRTNTSGELVPCYKELLKQGETFEIFKNKDPSCSLNAVCAGPGVCACPNAAVPVCMVLPGQRSCGYQNWVGQCEADFDRCEEFIDPINTSSANPLGKPYYYLLNDKLDSKTCGGTASLKQGCVLLKQTSNTQDLYSSPATYLTSTKRQDERVGPINCTPGLRDPACENRCYAVRDGKCANDTSKSCSNNDGCRTCSLAPTRFCSSNADCLTNQGACTSSANNINRCIGAAAFGQGCDPVNGDNDCAVSAGEKCVPDMHCGITKSQFCTSDLDCPLTGTTSQHETCVLSTTPATRVITKNDSNLVLKVRGDRECAEWLTCNAATIDWDPNLNRNVQSCTDFVLCDQLKKVGKTFQCGHEVQRLSRLLTRDTYTARDTTYRGFEYSGFSLYNKYPSQSLQSINIAPGFCSLLSSGQPDTSKALRSCRKTTDCVPNAEFCSPPRKGLCIGSDGAPQTEVACDTDDQCTDRLCSTNFLTITRFGILRDDLAVDPRKKTCETNADCKPDRPSGENGSCLNHRCYYDFAGGALKIADKMTAPSCRAYPDADAPFPFTVLNSQVDRGYDKKGNAVNRKSAYKGANICADRNECECSYQRIAYGTGGGFVRYLSLNQALNESKGVCVGGPNEGVECTLHLTPQDTATECGETKDGGICSRVTKKTYSRGWPGFCIDPDRSVNINGEKNRYACNLWLPLDQLAGAPDIYNQAYEAGFNPPPGFKTISYCQEKEDLGPGNYERDMMDETSGMFGTDVGACPNPCVKDNVDKRCENPDGNKCTSCPSGCTWDNGLDQRCEKADQSQCDTPAATTNPGCYVQNPGGCAVTATAMFFICGPTCSAGYGTMCGLGAAACSSWINESDNPNYNDNPDKYPIRPLLFNYDKNPRRVSKDVSSFNYKKDQLAGIKVTFKEGGQVMYLYPNNQNDWTNYHVWNGDSTGPDNINGDYGQPNIYVNGSVGQAGQYNYGVGGYNKLPSPNGKGADELPINGIDDPGPGEGASHAGCMSLLDPNLTAAQFEAACRTKISGTENCLALRAKFTGDTLTSIDSVLCHQGGSFFGAIGHYIPVKVTAFLRQNCMEIDKVFESDSFTGIGSPQTNNLWLAAQQPQTLPPVLAPLSPFKYVQTTARPNVVLPDLTPFGPISPPEYEIVSNPADGSLISRPKADDGRPFVLWNSEGFTGALNATVTTVIADATGGKTINLNNFRYSTVKGVTVAGNLMRKADQIPLLFAHAFKVYRWGGQGVYVETNVQSSLWDQRGTRTSVSQQPQVHSVMSGQGKCSTSVQGACLEGGVGVTVEPSPYVGANGQYKANIRFFAWADSNHMPIKKTVVDFGDGKRKPAYPDSAYKNRRGLDPTDASLNTNICRTGADEFGKLLNACEPRYFEESHTYLCSKENVEAGPVDPLKPDKYPECDSDASKRKYPCKRANDQTCVFKPKVQITDNWGVCNGTCPGGDGGAICFLDECGNSDDDRSPIYDPTAEDQPWTKFSDEIVVPAA